MILHAYISLPASNFWKKILCLNQDFALQVLYFGKHLHLLVDSARLSRKGSSRPARLAVRKANISSYGRKTSQNQQHDP